MKLIVLFVGPAGSGKSTLVAAYSDWLREGGIPVYIVNLDPAAETLPYHPDYDIRNMVNAREVAVKYGLGPNGALVKSMEIAAEKVEEIVAAIAEAEADYVLIDTPGQMEVFLFRDISWKLTNALRKVSEEVYAIFVLDTSVIRDPADYAFLTVLSAAVQLRLGIETAPVLNKVDLAPNLDYRGDIVRDFAKLRKRLLSGHSLYTEMLREMLRVIYKYSKSVNVPRVSAAKRQGMEELDSLIKEMGCTCGDLS